MTQAKPSLPAASVFLALAGCGLSQGVRQEDVASLRSLGYIPSQLSTTPSASASSLTQVKATFYAAVPLGQTATVVPFVDTGSSEGAYQLGREAIHVDDGSASYAVHQSFQLYHIDLAVDIPTATTLGSGASWAGRQIEYGLTVSAGGVSESSVANLNVFPTGSAQLGWQPATLSLTAPASGASVSMASTGSGRSKKAAQIPITASVVDPVGENGIVGWFVGNGDIANRRSDSTTWTPSATGSQTLLVVYHGVTTRTFALQAIDVTVTD